MKRKVNRVGQNTLTVSLPSKWVKKFNITQGDEIDVIEDGSCLNIIPGSSDSKPKSKELIFTHKDISYTYLRSAISSIYRQGFDMIHLKFPGILPIENLQKVVGSLYGLEIIDESQSSCSIKSLLTEREDPKSIINKMFLVIKLFNDYYESIFNGNTDNIPDLEYIKQRLMKKRDYAQRMINLEGSEVAFALRNTVFLLYKIGSAHVYQLKYLCQNKVKVSKETALLIKKLQNFTNDLHTAFLKSDYNISAKIYFKLHEMVKNDYFKDYYAKLCQNSKFNVEISVGYYYFINLLSSLSSRIHSLNM